MSAFDRTDRLEHELPDILVAIAAPRMPDYVDDLLAQAAATRQRRRWTFLERWLPMGELAHYSATYPSFPWRPVVAAMLLLALVAAALLAVGSPRRVPPPFGPARNGAMVFGNGDISVRDSLDEPARLVIGGPTDDFAGGFTRDGMRLVFLRRVAGTEGTPDERLQLFMAGSDGSNVTAVTPPLIAPDWADFAPDNGSMVFISGSPSIGQSLFVANLREVGEPRQLVVGDPPLSATFPNYLAPDGAEIVFRGQQSVAAGGRSGIFAVHPDGTGLRPITPTNGDHDNDYQFPQPSPDGRYVAYTAWDTVFHGVRVHILDLRTGEDRNLTDVGRSEGYATFSPDSRRIVFTNYLSDRNQIMVEPIDGSARPLAMGPNYRQVNNGGVGGLFSPDGKWLIVTDPGTHETRLIDSAKGGQGTLLAWSAADLSGWQRLAP